MVSTPFESIQWYMLPFQPSPKVSRIVNVKHGAIGVGFGEGLIVVVGAMLNEGAAEGAGVGFGEGLMVEGAVEGPGEAGGQTW